MKKSILYTCTALLLVVLFACEKDNDYGTLPTTASNSDYLPDNTANYWVYDIYRVDSSGVETILGTDTMIVDDTTIRGKDYKKYKYRLFPNAHQFQTLMRDSADYMINEMGRKIFTTNTLNTVLEKDSAANPFIFSFEMIKEPNCINVPSGTYCDVLNYRQHIEINSTIPDPLKPYRQKYSHSRYAKGIGLIFHSYFYASASHLEHYERRLVSFHLVK